MQLVGSPVNCTVRRAAGNDTTAEVGGTQQRTPAQEEASVLNAIMASNPNLRATQVQKATWARRAHIAPQIHSTRVACACYTGNRVFASADVSALACMATAGAQLHGDVVLRRSQVRTVRPREGRRAGASERGNEGETRVGEAGLYWLGSRLLR